MICALAILQSEQITMHGAAQRAIEYLAFMQGIAGMRTDVVQHVLAPFVLQQQQIVALQVENLTVAVMQIGQALQPMKMLGVHRLRRL
jgi:hypothetical protein